MHPKTTHSLFSLPPESDRGENRKSKSEKNLWVKINTCSIHEEKGKEKTKLMQGQSNA